MFPCLNDMGRYYYRFGRLDDSFNWLFLDPLSRKASRTLARQGDRCTCHLANLPNPAGRFGVFPYFSLSSCAQTDSNAISSTGITSSLPRKIVRSERITASAPARISPLRSVDRVIRSTSLR